MKKAFAIFVLIGLIVMSFMPPTDNKDQATVNQVEGIYVYALSKPNAETTYLGTVEIGGIVSSTKAGHMLKLLIEKTKKKFPTAQAIIITNEDFEKCDAVTFK